MGRQAERVKAPPPSLCHPPSLSHHPYPPLPNQALERQCQCPVPVPRQRWWSTVRKLQVTALAPERMLLTSHNHRLKWNQGKGGGGGHLTWRTHGVVGNIRGKCVVVVWGFPLALGTSADVLLLDRKGPQRAKGHFEDDEVGANCTLDCAMFLGRRGVHWVLVAQVFAVLRSRFGRWYKCKMKDVLGVPTSTR